MKIELVTLDKLAQNLLECKTYLDTAIAESPNDLNYEVVCNSLRRNKSYLITISDEVGIIIACHVLQIIKFDTGHKVVFISLSAGAYMDEWLDDFLEFVNEYAITNNCDEIRDEWYPVHAVIGCKVRK